MKKILLALNAGVFACCLQAQNNNITIEYVDGYALRRDDSIRCKIKVSNKHAFNTGSVTLLISNDEITFPAGGIIKGYGLEYDNKKYDLATVKVETKIGGNMNTTPMFIMKIVSGVVDFYAYRYRIGTTKKTYVNNMLKPGATTTTQEDYVNYYIAKNDSTVAELKTPVLLQSFRKKDIEPYIADNAELAARVEKRFNPEELIVIIREYNQWYRDKKKSK